MPNFFIFANSVLSFIPKITAAPFAPLTRHLVWKRTSRIYAFCTASKVRNLSPFLLMDLFLGIQSPGKSVVPDSIIIARSIRFSSSRMLPGKSYLLSSSIAFFEIRLNDFPDFVLNFSKKN